MQTVYPTRQELKQAEANRERVAQDYCGSYYEAQKRLIQAWKPEDKPPEGLRLAGSNFSASDILWRHNRLRTQQALKTLLGI